MKDLQFAICVGCVPTAKILFFQQNNSYKDRHLNKDRNDVIISFNFKFNELKYLRKKTFI